MEAADASPALAGPAVPEAPPQLPAGSEAPLPDAVSWYSMQAEHFNFLLPP